MEKKKGYLHKFTLTEKFIAFCISIAISYITIISILLHDDFLALRDGTLYFFISLFLYFFISLAFIKNHIRLTTFFLIKLTRKNLNLSKKILRSFIFPSIFLAGGFLTIFIISIYQVSLSLLPSSDFITNNSIAQEVNSRYTLLIIMIFIISIAVFQITNLSKIQRLKISVCIISTLLSLVITSLSFFVVSRILIILYWIIIIFTTPWVPG